MLALVLLIQAAGALLHFAGAAARASAGCAG